MKTNFFFAFAVLFLNAGFAQESRWSGGLGFSPDICFRSLSGNPGDPFLRNRNQYEEVKTGYTSGLWLQHRLGSILQLESGIQYSNKGYAYRMMLVMGTQVDPTRGFTGETEMLTYHHFHYLDVPLKANIRLSRREKTNYHVTGGVAMNLFLGQKNVTYFTPEFEGDRKSTSYGDNMFDNAPVNMTPFFGVGMDIRIRNTMHMALEPTFRYSVVPVHTGDPVQTRLWCYGVNAVLYYRL